VNRHRDARQLKESVAAITESNPQVEKRVADQIPGAILQRVIGNRVLDDELWYRAQLSPATSHIEMNAPAETDQDCLFADSHANHGRMIDAIAPIENG